MFVYLYNAFGYPCTNNLVNLPPPFPHSLLCWHFIEHSGYTAEGWRYRKFLRFVLSMAPRLPQPPLLAAAITTAWSQSLAAAASISCYSAAPSVSLSDDAHSPTSSSSSSMYHR